MFCIPGEDREVSHVDRVHVPVTWTAFRVQAEVQGTERDRNLTGFLQCNPCSAHLPRSERVLSLLGFAGLGFRPVGGR